MLRSGPVGPGTAERRPSSSIGAATKLLQLLTGPAHIGRVRFWFNVRGFDAPWFSARLDEAIQSTGPRYTPEIHVDLPIASEFEAFGRTDHFFDGAKATARGVRKHLREIQYSETATDPTVDAKSAAVSEKIRAVLTSVDAIDGQPTARLPFQAILKQLDDASEAAEELVQLLGERQLEARPKPKSTNTNASRSPHPSNPLRDSEIRFRRLISELEVVRESFLHADEIASSRLLIVRGAAGTGKTHLLCDLARQRVAAGRPTVLLMGQRFVSTDEPWSQAREQLDLSSLSVEEFVGALESSAEAAGSRALFMIDAINEGTGRDIWPSHLAPFLTHLHRSPWIGVVIAVRSSFEDVVVPDDVRSGAAIVTHWGFAGHEYDATKTFFLHFGLEFPSTPLLAPEFRNPLFLKTLCKGLQARGERHMPRGLQGITTVFDLYLNAVNARLAASLDFHAGAPLVRQAVEAVAEIIVNSGERWLALAKAGEAVNHLLPGRDLSKSLYRGLVAEGVLVEDVARLPGGSEEVIVFLAYERLADHLVARCLLGKYVDVEDPAPAFAEGGLAFICDNEHYVSAGLLEALSIQIPELTGRELISIAPACADRPMYGDAFRQSLVWRTYGAFSEDTREVLNRLDRSEHDRRDTLDVLLTVATLPGHPFNAEFLDGRLQRDAMADRDAWWSVYLHAAYGTQGAVDRLVDWASSVGPETSIDEEVVDLCAVTLSWMLSTSNRFLRDRATAALVDLLTDRLAAVVRLVGRFADLEEPYVVERVYAVAYGVAMRCQDPGAAALLASRVYEAVFASGYPAPHILLRDYARGVVERALHLGSEIDVTADCVRPPYGSKWPRIPTKDDVRPLLQDWSRGSWDSGELEWARNRIGNSVMDDDFARYVIGTNSSYVEWLSVKLADEQWRPSRRREDLLGALVWEFSAEEREAWEECVAAEKAYATKAGSFGSEPAVQPEKGGGSGRGGAGEGAGEAESGGAGVGGARSVEIEALKERRRRAIGVLETVLSGEHVRRLGKIVSAPEQDWESRRGPRFDLREIQRYVLWRVFDLGWTTERFGRFDRFSVGMQGRDARKAERIGKKYQWIAYHEIMAFISDHYQYRDLFREEDGDQAYDGPWQSNFRDIDPSCTLRSVRGGTSWDGHVPSWWGAAAYDSWGEPRGARNWILKADDLPKLEDLLLARNPEDGSRWVNGHGFFSWKQATPVGRERSDVERRELSYKVTGYLVGVDDAEVLMQWAEGVDFAGRGMAEVAEVHYMFLGEHGWAPACRYFQQPYYGDSGWARPTDDCPVEIRAVAREYRRETGGFDCAIDESYVLALPVDDLVDALGLRWAGRGADFMDGAGRVGAQDPTVHSEGPSAMLLREDLLAEFLERERLVMWWTVLGEKWVIPAERGSGRYHGRLNVSGAYVYSEGRVRGFVKHILDDRSANGEDE